MGTNPACGYSVDEDPYPIAEHELAHALGLTGHFNGFTGDEGLSPQLIAVLVALYRLAPGADVSSAYPPC